MEKNGSSLHLPWKDMAHIFSFSGYKFTYAQGAQYSIFAKRKTLHNILQRSLNFFTKNTSIGVKKPNVSMLQRSRYVALHDSAAIGKFLSLSY
jgi:hypothetical protein